MRNWFKPARAKAAAWMKDPSHGGANIVADLDAILTEPIHFRLLGKVHTLEPITTENFLLYTNALAKLFQMRDEKMISSQDLIQRYFDLFSSVCKTIELKDIQGMTQAQVAGLYQLILDSFQGKSQAELEKKTLQHRTLVRHSEN